MKTIDLNRIREALPKRAKVTLGKTKHGIPFIECKVSSPSLYDKGTKEEQEDVEDSDVNSLTGLDLVKDGQLCK